MLFRSRVLFRSIEEQEDEDTEDEDGDKEEKLERVKNYNVSVEEINDEIIFLRKLIPGGSEHSFGINVAQLAGMPNQILIRAYEVLRELEKNTLKKSVKKSLEKESKQLKLKYSDPEFDKVKKIIEEININNINPVQAIE